MNDTLKSKSERGFFVALLLAGFLGFMWLILKYPLLNAAVLTIAPIIAAWLWKFWQEKFDEPSLVTLKKYFMVGSLLSAAFLLFTSPLAEAKIDNIFLEGEIQSQEVVIEKEESNIVTEKRHAFILKNENDSWKKKIITWYMWFMIIGSPIICIVCLGKLRPVYNKKPELVKTVPGT